LGNYGFPAGEVADNPTELGIPTRIGRTATGTSFGLPLTNGGDGDQTFAEHAMSRIRLVIKNKVVLGQRLNIYPALILIRDGRLATPRGRWLCL